MKLEIRGYLENNTNQTQLWTNLQEMYDVLIPTTEVIEELTEEEAQKGILFSLTLVDMINNKEVRLDQKQDSSFNIALESFIQDKINSTKKSAVEEMEDELQKCVESEDYENAAEYRDMIKEYKNK